jgi:hypothetical protein
MSETRIPQDQIAGLRRHMNDPASRYVREPIFFAIYIDGRLPRPSIAVTK